MSKLDEGYFYCMIYGHKHPVPAPGVPGECYTIPGALYVVELPKKNLAKEHRSSILDEFEEDHTNIG